MSTLFERSVDFGDVDVSQLSKTSGNTAMKNRRGTSVPLRDTIIPKITIEDRVLHQGAGALNNPDRATLDGVAGEVVHYDINHTPQTESLLGKGDFDVVVCIYVLDVIPVDLRAQCVKTAYDSLKPGGIAYFAVRGIGDVPIDGKPNWKSYEDGWLVRLKGTWNFQKGFTSDDVIQAISPPFNATIIKNTKTAVIAVGVK